jgi:hypothetical protein
MKHIEKTLNCLVWLLIGAVMIQALMAIYFNNIYQKPSVTWSSKVFTVVNKEIKQGDPIIATVQRCSKDTYSASVTRAIVDGIAYPIPEAKLIFLKGCVKETRYVPNVTTNIPPGTYYLMNKIEIPIRWLWFSRIDKYETQTEPFTIIAPRIDPEAATTP